MSQEVRFPGLAGSCLRQQLLPGGEQQPAEYCGIHRGIVTPRALVRLRMEAVSWERAIADVRPFLEPGRGLRAC